MNSADVGREEIMKSEELENEELWNQEFKKSKNGHWRDIELEIGN